MPRALSNGLTDVRAAGVRDDFANEIIGRLTSIRTNTVNAGPEPLLFAGEVAVLMRD